MKKLSTTPSHTAFGYIAARMGRRFFDHDVGRDSAALTYYLLFSIFPLLIFISTLIGILHLNVDSITRDLSQIAPAETVEVVDSYLRYVTENSSRQLMWFSLIFSVWFPMRATACLMHSMRKAFCRPKPAQPLVNLFRVFLFTIGLIVTIGGSMILTVLGRRALRFISHFFTLTPGFIEAWTYLRFILLFILMAFAIGTLYMLSQGERRPLREVLPGVFSSLIAWTGLSIAFSYYVEHMSHYAQFYGSIAAIVVSLLWLFMSSMVLILGAELSGILREYRAQNRKEYEP